MNISKIPYIIFIFLFFIPSVTKAETVEELKGKIDARNDAIKTLEQDIKNFQIEIEALGKEKASLNNSIKTLDVSKKKLTADIKITENKIAARNLELKELSLQIGDKSERITDSKRVISQSLYTISQMNTASVIETILSQKSLSDVWNGADQLITLQDNMQDKIVDLEGLKANLEVNKKLTEKKKRELLVLTEDLRDQTKIIADTVAEKNSILKETKNAESNYNKLLATKKQQKEAYEREVFEFESALKIAIDPNSIPNTASGVLKYPIDKVIITQYFGNTEFATKNPQVYNGKGHTGVDFGVSMGTKVKSALGGVVSGTGNTDLARGCASYGKWVMVKHPNGMSTLYAHLSLISVKTGQAVSTGGLLGYSGNTGYSTGPHLHFGVYATEGVRITKLKNSKNCTGVVIPLADLKAYLNPLSYL
jgi:murein DD-endopeptidase MepM/ murein hydrolase activator NlpD